jgi:hypothetical protein
MTKRRSIRNRKPRPLSFRAWEAVNKLRMDLAYRFPQRDERDKLRPRRSPKHVVLRREHAVALLAETARRWPPGVPLKHHIRRFELVDVPLLRKPVPKWQREGDAR